MTPPEEPLVPRPPGEYGHPQPRVPSSSRGRDVALWVVGAVLLAAPMVLTGLRESDGGMAFALGAALGTAVVGLVVATLVRLFWTRVVRRGRPLWRPSLLMIAALVSLLGIVARTGQELQERDDRFAAFAGRSESCEATQPDPLPALDGKLSYRDLTAAQVEQLESQAPAALDEIAQVDGRQVLLGRRLVASVVTMPGFSAGGDREDYLEGFSDAAEDQHLQVRSIEVADGSGRIATTDGTATLAGFNGCHAFAISSVDEPTVLFVARRLFPEAPPSG